MDNPFIEDGYLCLNASINKLFIEKMPTTKVKQDLQGKTAIDIFSAKLLIDEIKKNSKDLKLDIDNLEEKVLPQYLDSLLQSDDLLVKKTAQNIVRLFGERLGVILLTLKKGEKENRLKRKDWGDREWEFWGTIESIILVGGLASSNIGENLKYYAEKVFEDFGKSSYNIILIKDSSNIGIKGCTTYIKDISKEKTHIIFDFGQTFIKRSLVKGDNRGVKDIKNLTKVLSKYVDWDFKNIEEEKGEADNLNKHILNTILDTVEIAKKEGNDNIGDTIVMSIANYIRNGALADRGGYGKLRLIADDYEKYLSFVLSQRIKKRFNVKLVHDGTAMASAFLDYPNSVCISLGTAFGIGFPRN